MRNELNLEEKGECDERKKRGKISLLEKFGGRFGSDMCKMIDGKVEMELRVD